MAHITTWDESGIVVEYSGAVTDREIHLTVTEFQADARYDFVKWILHDFTCCDRLSFSLDGMEEIAACDSAAALSNPGHKVAIFPARPEIRQMVAIYLDTGLRPPDKVRLFDDAESAKSWARSSR